MSYTKQTFVDGQVLKAEHLNHIEAGIVALENAIGSLGSTTAAIETVTLLSKDWVASGSSGNLYSQEVTIAGVTENSQVNLTPSVEQLVAFYEKDLSFVTENEGGTVTVYAIGQKPTNDYTIQVTITEVNV